MRRFAKTVVKVLLSYVEIVKADFPEQMKNERIVREMFCCFSNFEKSNILNVFFSILGLRFDE